MTALSGQASAQAVPSFRVPMGSEPTNTNVAATYDWLSQIGTCSTTCGTGTRTTSYQCQNVADYDYAGAGYGMPEPESACVSTVGSRPADSSSSCTVYSGCGYDWVKPPASQDPVPLESNPKGRIGCGFIHQKFTPFCQRSGGGDTLQMAAGDHRFCSADRPDYNDVAAGVPDALGYDRNVVQTGVCAPQDHDWIQGGFGTWSSDCSTNATRTQVVSCKRRFDGKTYATAAEEDYACGGTRPNATETSARYGSCSYSYAYSEWSAWSSSCDTNAKRTRNATCMRSNDGGEAVAESSCSAAGVTKQGVSETSPQYDSCTYEFKTAAWGAFNSGCSTSAVRTRDVWCQRSNNDRVDNGECTDRGQAMPATTEAAAQYGSCSYSWEQGGFGSWSSGCANAATRTQSVRCKRDLDGATAADTSCSGAKPPFSQTAGEYSSCSYKAGGTPTGWSGWNDGCSTNATRTRQYQCIRSNDGGQIVPDGECLGRGVGLTETQTGEHYGSCSYRLEDSGVGACNGTNKPHYWTCIRTNTGQGVDSATYCGRPNPTYETCTDSYSLRDAGVGACQTNDQAPHYWGCVRDRTGEQVDSATYCGKSNPTYEACRYPWTYRLEDAGVGACNGASKPHYWRCIREQDGAQVDSATYCGRANPTYESCTYTYTLTDGGVGSCQTNNQAPHYWSCRRNETGEPVDSAQFCGRGNPTYETCTYGWSYTAGYGAFSACSNGTQTQSITSCTRADGTAVDPSQCTAAGQPATRSQTCTVQGCPDPNNLSGWGTWHYCSGNARMMTQAELVELYNYNWDVSRFFRAHPNLSCVNDVTMYPTGGTQSDSAEDYYYVSDGVLTPIPYPQTGKTDSTEFWPYSQRPTFGGGSLQHMGWSTKSCVK
jgi:hypothetical protein